MSGTIGAMREEGFTGVTMVYEEGGRIEVWTWGKATIRVPAMTSNEEVKRLLKEASG